MKKNTSDAEISKLPILIEGQNISLFPLEDKQERKGFNKEINIDWQVQI